MNIAEYSNTSAATIPIALNGNDEKGIIAQRRLYINGRFWWWAHLGWVTYKNLNK